MNPYIQSLRLRTLPLSVSGIILGTGLAWKGFAQPVPKGRAELIFALAILTTLSLQILSNLCNELGDAQKGTDAEQKGREAYGLQAGTLTEKDLKRMIAGAILSSMLFGSSLLLAAFDLRHSIGAFIVFVALGLLAIIGAVTYTLGKHSYGYHGLGDLSVLLFFGLLSTLGAHYLQAQTLTWDAVICGVAIGLPCVGVLNLNNIRDMNNDLKHGKHTFASWLGHRGARVYQAMLLCGSLLLFLCMGHYWTACVVPVWAWHIGYVARRQEGLDKQMPVLMFSTLVVAILALL